MASPAEDLADNIKSSAEKKVGGKAVDGGKDKGGIDCFALVDELLKSAGGKRPKDFGDVTPTADYVWGDPVELDKIKPGDILQFRDHFVMIRTQKLGEVTWEDMSVEGPARRPHHTAVVVDVQNDGSVVVVEQNVRPDPKKVRRSVIAGLAAGEETRRKGGGLREIITVTGTVRAYRPVPKTDAKPAKPEKGKSEKGTMLFLVPQHQDSDGVGQRMLAQHSPREGGAKRQPGSLGKA
ncbi:MAG TPA: CHAP domain-containing protein [Candidatus Sulfotelmatobacter sp.]|nr:CHAP domain-containing protein [Candidatus Sulfotelmatobacter sp.]